MGWGDVASASKTVEKYVSRRSEQDRTPAIKGTAIETGERLITKGPVILDMGEASREQGFRLNGCR